MMSTNVLFCPKDIQFPGRENKKNIHIHIWEAGTGEFFQFLLKKNNELVIKICCLNCCQ